MSKVSTASTNPNDATYGMTASELAVRSTLEDAVQDRKGSGGETIFQLRDRCAKADAALLAHVQSCAQRIFLSGYQGDKNIAQMPPHPHG
jgi:hypothetical protein